MKTLKRTFIIALSACLMLFAGILIAGSTTDKKAEAASADNNIPPEYYYDKIYYFSDSAPILNKDFLDAYGYSKNVVYDQKTLISAQQLAFLVYTGYFWKFPCDPDAHCIVIVELKTIHADNKTLSDLFTCLEDQDCKIMYISPYATQYSGEANPDISIPCNSDDYADFLDYSIIDMQNKSIDSIWYTNTCILLDGRFIGIDYYPNVFSTYYAPLVLSASNFFQRMLLDMYYGPSDANYNPDATKRINFEKAMYADLWQFFYEYYYKEYEYDWTYSDLVIGKMINLWKTTDFNYYSFMTEHWTEYNEYSQEIIWNYFRNGSEQGNDAVISELIEADTHILVNLLGTDYYWDILRYDPDLTSTIYQFTNTEDFSRYFENYRVYIMGIWKLDFYDFAKALQDYFLDKKEILIPIYIWPEDPIEWSPDGLIITTFDNLASDYSLEKTYDEDRLKEDIFEQLLALLETFVNSRYGATA